MNRWSQDSRTKSLIARSSVVTQALMVNGARVGAGEYKKLQQFESKAVAAGAAYEAAASRLEAAQAKQDEAERDLAALNSACLVACKTRGTGVDLFEQLDRGDVVGLATHLDGPVSKIETLGPMLAELLRHQRKTLARCVTAVEPESQAAAKALDDLRSALFQLEAGISTALAALAGVGINLKFAKAKRQKKPKSALATKVVPAPIVETPVIAPAPSNGAASTDQPAMPAVVSGDVIS